MFNCDVNEAPIRMACIHQYCIRAYLFRVIFLYPKVRKEEKNKTDSDEERKIGIKEEEIELGEIKIAQCSLFSFE